MLNLKKMLLLSTFMIVGNIFSAPDVVENDVQLPTSRSNRTFGSYLRSLSKSAKIGLGACVAIPLGLIAYHVRNKINEQNEKPQISAEIKTLTVKMDNAEITETLFDSTSRNFIERFSDRDNLRFVKIYLDNSVVFEFETSCVFDENFLMPLTRENQADKNQFCLNVRTGFVVNTDGLDHIFEVNGKQVQYQIPEACRLIYKVEGKVIEIKDETDGAKIISVNIAEDESSPPNIKTITLTQEQFYELKHESVDLKNDDEVLLTLDIGDNPTNLERSK